MAAKSQGGIEKRRPRSWSQDFDDLAKEHWQVRSGGSLPARDDLRRFGRIARRVQLLVLFLELARVGSSVPFAARRLVHRLKGFLSARALINRNARQVTLRELEKCFAVHGLRKELSAAGT